MTYFPLIFTMLSAPALQFMPRTITSKSQLTRNTQTVGFPDGQWMLNAKINAKTAKQILEWRAFGAEIGGSAGVFDYYVLDKYRAEKDGLNFSDGTDFDDLTGFSNAYNPVSAALQGATTIILSGFPTADIIKRGHYIQINDYFHVITSASLNAGVYTLGLWPPLRENIDTNASLVLDYPVVKMRMVDDEQTMFEPDAQGHFDLTFKSMEAV